MSYVKQGEDALQKAINILSEQDGWTIETVAVSIEITLILDTTLKYFLLFWYVLKDIFVSISTL